MDGRLGRPGWARVTYIMYSYMYVYMYDRGSRVAGSPPPPPRMVSSVPGSRVAGRPPPAPYGIPLYPVSITPLRRTVHSVRHSIAYGTELSIQTPKYNIRHGQPETCADSYGQSGQSRQVTNNHHRAFPVQPTKTNRYVQTRPNTTQPGTSCFELRFLLLCIALDCGAFA